MSPACRSRKLRGHSSILGSSSPDDPRHVVSTSTTLMRIYTGNQISNLSLNSHVFCMSSKEAKRTFLTLIHNSSLGIFSSFCRAFKSSALSQLAQNIFCLFITSFFPLRLVQLIWKYRTLKSTIAYKNGDVYMYVCNPAIFTLFLRMRRYTYWDRTTARNRFL